MTRTTMHRPEATRRSTRVELRPPTDKLTAVPYSTPDDPDRRFIDLRAHPEQVELIGELDGRPAMREQIMLLDARSSPFFSIGCERAVSRLRREDGSPVWKTTSYVQFAFVEQDRCEIMTYEPFVRALHAGLDCGADSDEWNRLVELEPDPIVLQPTGRRAWSLTIWTTAYALDGETSVHEWSLCMLAQTSVMRSWIRFGGDG